MMSGPNGLIPLVVALVPAALRWWMGVRLLGRLDEATFPERLAAHHQRNGAVFAFAILVLIWTSPRATFWSLPLLILSRTAAGFPFRRQIYGESWSLAGMLFFFGRLIAGVYGFWLLAINTPFLASRAGRFDWMAAALLGAILIAWHERYPETLRRLLRARPVQDRLLLERFRPMAAAAPPDRPWLFEYVNMNGGALANALALPSLRRSTVLFTSTLLERLDADEITAICAHEIAHLEYYSPDRMRRYRWVDFGLIGLSLIAAPISRVAFPSEAAFAWLLVPLVILFALVVRARDRQRNETASDVRAIALCGDADALARALTKLYQFARVPRRFDAYRERTATHPSLARRIRDIRAAAGLQPAAVSSSSAFDAAHGPARVVFTPARLEWREHEGATHALEYSHLSELRLQPQRDGAQLVAVERTGRRWQMPVLAQDLAAIQATLDGVDGRLGAFTAPRISPGFARLMALVAMLIGAAAAQFACALVALVAFLRPNANLVAGSGVAAVTGASLLLRDGSARGRASIAAMLFITGSALMALAWLMRGDRTESPSMKPVATLAAAAALMLLFLMSGGLDRVRLHQSARALPSATILLTALATVLVTERTRTVRAAAVIPLLLAAITAGAGSMSFLYRLCSDPFLVQAAPAIQRPVLARATTTFRIPFVPSEMRLSPAGEQLAIAPDEDPDSGQHAVRTFHVSSSEGGLVPIAADDVAFVDEGHVLAVRFDGADADLQELATAAPKEALWRQRIPQMRSGTVRFSPSAHEWQLLGWTNERTIVSVRGRLDSSTPARFEWTVPNREGWVSAMMASDRHALVVDATYEAGLFGGDPFRLWYRLREPRYSARVWRLDVGAPERIAESHLDNVTCSGDAVADSLVCVAFDGVRTRIASVAGDSARITPVASIEGRFRTTNTTVDGWVTGWIGRTPVALRTATNELLHLPAPRGEWTEALAGAANTIATASSVGDENIVRIYTVK
jgi:Zn-dependent protease with chaperone function